MKTNLLLVFSLLMSTILSGQISGKIIAADDSPLEFANVILNNAADSIMVKVALSDEKGTYNFPAIAAGEYFIQISYVGLPDGFSDEINYAGGELTVAPIFMGKADVSLESVTVTAQRPLLEIKPDKMVFNVDGSVNASGNSLMELLQKAPGVVVDNNENITMLGKSGVRIYINGKQLPLSGDDLTNYLKNILAEEIDNIEIISNPGARFDAEGAGGVINIILRRDKSLGANANLNLGYAVGERMTYTGNLSGNFRNKKMNAFGSYGYNHNENSNFFNLYREQVGGYYDQRNTSEWNGENHSYKLGADFYVGEKSTVGFLVNGYFNNSHSLSNSRTEIGQIQPATFDSILVASTDDVGSRNNFNANLNYRFNNKKGSTWNVDLDFGKFMNEGMQIQPNTYMDPTGEVLLQKTEFFIDSPTDINIYTAKVDYERPLGEGKLGAGLKSALVNTDNVFNFYEVINTERIKDLDRTNEFDYTENVNAAYVTYSRQFKKIGITAGLRSEWTESEGVLTAFKDIDNKDVKQSYVDLFPSAGINYIINQKNTLALNYSRRINRPSYQDLNPFEFRLDELTFRKGNPFLNPEYANSIQLTHTYNYSINTSVGWTRTNNLITDITDTSGVSESFISYLNLATQDNISLNVSGALPISKWWNSYSSLSFYQTYNRADFGDGKIVNLKVPSFNIYMQHTFTLPWEVKLELSGWWNSKSIWGATFETDPMGSIDAGLQKKVFGKRGTLKISVSDVFRSQEWSAVSQFGALYMDTEGGRDSRRLRVNFNYTFGNQQVKSSRRKSGLEEENKRIKS